MIVGQIAHGSTHDEILNGYPDLERQDVRQALEYAAWPTQKQVQSFQSFVRFLADMGVSARIVSWLSEQGCNAIHLRDERLQRLPEGEIFGKAVAEDRAIL